MTISSEQEVAKAGELLSELLDKMGFDARVEASEAEDRIVLDVQCDEPERIIGRRGSNIDAIQHVVGKMLSKHREARGKPVLVDTDGYRGRHIERLEGLADRMAEKALDTGREVEMNPMSAYDRRIVHIRLKETDGVETRSEGEDPDRRVIVIPGSEPV